MGSAVTALGDDHEVDFLTVRFGNRAFIADRAVPVSHDRIRLDQVKGQVNAWDGGKAGALVSSDATLTGTIVCTTVEGDR
jgi:hypothetical protein